MRRVCFIVAMLFVACSRGNESSVSEKLPVTDSTIQRLRDFRAEPKFLEDKAGQHLHQYYRNRQVAYNNASQQHFASG